MMKTLQNNTWIHYLTLGLIFSLLTSGSCNKISEWGQEGEFYFVNKTTHKIAIIEQRLNLEIEPLQTYYLSQIQPSQKVVRPEDYQHPLSEGIGTSLEVTIHIGDKCLKQVKSDVNSILNIKSYTAEKLGERKYKFTYTFTDADYERAVACP